MLPILGILYSPMIGLLAYWSILLFFGLLFRKHYLSRGERRAFPIVLTITLILALISIVASNQGRLLLQLI